VKNFSPTLQDAALATSFHWTLSEPIQITAESDKRQIQAEMDLHLMLPHDPHDQFINSTLALINRIKKAFPNFDVTNSELPGLLSDTKELKTVIDDNNIAPVATGINQNDTIKLDIRGPGVKNGK
jgi:hypothetical protein